MFLFLLTRFKKEGLSQNDAESKARYYNIWASLGYDYNNFKSDFQEKVLPANHKKPLEENKFLIALWETLNKKRTFLAKNLSVSTAINLGMFQCFIILHTGNFMLT
jgi:hypothetical protein